MSMDVSIVIVSWNVKPLLERCLRSVFAHVRGVQFEVLVVDNASSDGSAAAMAAAFPQATIIANTRNEGFAAACNAAIERATGEYVLLLNPDCALRDDAVSAMVGWMRSHADVAIMGPRILNDDGSVQESVARFPKFADQALVMLKLHNILPHLPALKRYAYADFDYARESDVDQVKGAALLIRGTAIRRIGFMDAARFFVWYEEVDWCKRAKDAGLRVVYAPVASITHSGGASFGQVFGPARQAMLNRSMRRYMLKHHGVAPYLALLALHPLSMALAYLASPFRNARYATRT